MKRSTIRQATQIALDYHPKHPQRKHYAHYCFVVQNNQIIEWGYNTSGVPPVHFGYHARVNDIPKMHAEFNAMRKAKGVIDFQKEWEVINVRVNNRKQLRMSKPCKCCHAFLTMLGCSKFWYSHEHGFSKV